MPMCLTLPAPQVTWFSFSCVSPCHLALLSRHPFNLCQALTMVTGVLRGLSLLQRGVRVSELIGTPHWDDRCGGPARAACALRALRAACAASALRAARAVRGVHVLSYRDTRVAP